MKDYRTLAAELVARARARGADEADVYVSSSRSLSIETRLGRLEKLEECAPEGLGLRLFKGGATALTYSSDLSPASLDRLLDDSLRLVAIIDPNDAHRLPPPELLGCWEGSLELFDPTLEDVPLERKIRVTQEVEEAGRALDPRINNSNGAWWSDSTHQVTLANSLGFVGTYRMTSVGYGVSLVAEENGVKQTDAWWTSSRMLRRLEDPMHVGREAARRTIRKLGSRPVSTQVTDMVFDPLIGGDLLRILLSALSGNAIYRRNSFLVDRLGQAIGSRHLSVVDDATLPSGLASRPFDAEGVRSGRNVVVEGGVLKTYLCDAYAAARLGLQPTGNATRSYSSMPSVGATNFFLEPGTTAPEDILRAMKRGLYVTRLYWVGINLVTGDYSRGAEGIWVENGELTHPVQEITIASNMLDMMRQIEVVGNDLEFRSPTASPTFLVSNMVLSGP